jgi:hypothetical protein
MRDGKVEHGERIQAQLEELPKTSGLQKNCQPGESLNHHPYRKERRTRNGNEKKDRGKSL